MDTVAEFIAGLEARINFTSADIHDKEMFGTWAGGNIRVSFQIKLDRSGLTPDMPIQVVVHVGAEMPNPQGRELRYNRLCGWGCTSNEENAEFLRWFMRKEADLFSVRINEVDAVEVAQRDRWVSEGLSLKSM